jgi:hypothetical protein
MPVMREPGEVRVFKPNSNRRGEIPSAVRPINSAPGHAPHMANRRNIDPFALWTIVFERGSRGRRHQWSHVCGVGCQPLPSTALIGPDDNLICGHFHRKHR